MWSVVTDLEVSAIYDVISCHGAEDFSTSMIRSQAKGRADEQQLTFLHAVAYVTRKQASDHLTFRMHAALSRDNCALQASAVQAWGSLGGQASKLMQQTGRAHHDRQCTLG